MLSSSAFLLHLTQTTTSPDLSLLLLLLLLLAQVTYNQVQPL